MEIAGKIKLKKVLVLSYYFPPIGMGGTQRIAKFGKYLAEFGWEPTIITVLPISYWAIDETTLDELSHVRIIRTESLDPQRLLAKMGKKQLAKVGSGKGLAHFVNLKILPFFLLPDTKILWKKHCVQTVAKLLETESFDALFTTSPPHSVHLIGNKISKKFNLPWIADFRDSWAQGVVVHEPTFVQKWINQHLQNKVLRNADAVIAVTPGIVEDLSGPAGSRKKIYYVPNGYDFSELKKQQTKKNKFVFCHIGSITQFSHPEVLLKGFAELINIQPDLKQKLCLQFVGQNLINDLQALIETYNLNDVVEQSGYVSHQEALKKLANADGLILIAQGKQGAHFIPGKTFEYIGAAKPVLAITNVNDTINLLKDYSLATVVHPQNSTAITNAIHKIYMDKTKSGKNDSDFQKRFNRKAQTRQLAEILNSITEK